MKGKRKFSPEFKAKVALEAIKGQKTLNELSKEYELTPKQISEWKKEFLAKAALVFTKESPDLSKEKEIHELHARIGQLDMIVDFLKKVVTEHIPAPRQAGNLQHRPGEPVHQRGVHHDIGRRRS